MNGPTAILRKGVVDDRLLGIFPDGVPIVSRWPQMVDLSPEEQPPLGEPPICLAYFLHAGRCPFSTLREVAVYVAQQCGGGTADDVMASLMRGEEMPIRFSQVAAVILPPKAEECAEGTVGVNEEGGGR